MHSAVVTTALLDLVPGVTGMAGYHSDAPLTGDAHHAVRAAAHAALTPAQRTAAQRAALDHAASLGIGTLHECAGPQISDEEDFTSLLALAAERPDPGPASGPRRSPTRRAPAASGSSARSAR